MESDFFNNENFFLRKERIEVGVLGGVAVNDELGSWYSFLAELRDSGRKRWLGIPFSCLGEWARKWQGRTEKIGKRRIN